MIRTQVSLREDQHKILKELANKNDSSIAQEVREAVDFKLKKVQKKKYSINDLGKYTFEGPSDMSRRIDEFVYGYVQDSD